MGLGLRRERRGVGVKFGFGKGREKGRFVSGRVSWTCAICCSG